MAIPELLERLLAAPGPSGYEGAAAAVWREAASTFAEVKVDVMGSSYARVRGRSGRPVLAIVGHIDEIGIVVTHIEDSGVLAFRGLANRLGAYVALEAARLVAEAGEADADVVAVASVQEELELHGARAAAFSLDPDVAIVVDVTTATDSPGGDPTEAGKVELGAGPGLTRGSTRSPVVYEL